VYLLVVVAVELLLRHPLLELVELVVVALVEKGLRRELLELQILVVVVEDQCVVLLLQMVDQELLF
jgi:hypothetical protein